MKIRNGPPGDDEEDVAAGQRWAGVLPIRTGFGEPQTCPTLPAGEPVPAHVLFR